MTRFFSADRRFAALAILFESGLGVVAGVIGYLVSAPPLATVLEQGPSRWDTLPALAAGVAAAAPLVAALLLADRYPVGPLRELRDFLNTCLVPLFARCSAIQLLLVSLAAGIGEEMLFRGLIQAGVARWIGPPLGTAVGLLLASLAFGACHWLTATYAVLAAAVSVYLGVLFLVANNLLAPIAAHAVYDFSALLYLVRSWRLTQPDALGTPQEEKEKGRLDLKDRAATNTPDTKPNTSC